MTRAGWTALRWAALVPCSALAYFVTFWAVGSATTFILCPPTGCDVSSFGGPGSAFLLALVFVCTAAASLVAGWTAPRFAQVMALGAALTITLLLVLGAAAFDAAEDLPLPYAPAVPAFLGGVAALLIVRRWRR